MDVFFSKGTFVVVENNAVEKVFGEIVEICQENKCVKFDLKLYPELTFDEHVYCYILDKPKKEIVTKAVEDIPNFPPCFTVRKGIIVYCIPHYKL